MHSLPHVQNSGFNRTVDRLQFQTQLSINPHDELDQILHHFVKLGEKAEAKTVEEEETGRGIMP
jgi:hypothetical protein